MSPRTLSVVMEVTESDAILFIDSFKSTFSGLKKFITDQIENCKLKGYVETIRKRRRPLPNINSSDFRLRIKVCFSCISTKIKIEIF